jgi:Mn2+/Fe2+ NRAMP family transporter
VLVVNVIAVLAMPPALLFLYMLVNDREIMGEFVSPTWANVLALAVVVILIAAGLLFGVSVIAPHALSLIGGR